MAEPVLLGICDARVQQGTSWQVSKIGGNPDWMSAMVRHPLCSLCASRMHLIVQIYCPLGGSDYHRTLYVFACSQHPCRNQEGSWRVIRSQCKDQNPVAIETTKAEVTDTWGVAMDDWGDDEEDEAEQASNLCSEDVRDLTTSMAEVCVKEDIAEDESTEPTATSDDVEACFEPYYVNVFDEPSTRHEDFNHEQDLLAQYSSADQSAAQLLSKQVSKGSSGEAYEKTTAKHGDQLFHKFIKRLGHCPQQILRYSFNGAPLPMSEFQPPSSCTHCSSDLVFEMQLLPRLASCLTTPRAGDEIAMDFGNVMIFSCGQSCWNDSDESRSEHLVLQIDPESLLLK